MDNVELSRDGISAWLTNSGIDLLLRVEGHKPQRSTIDYAGLGTLAGNTIEVAIESDDLVVVTNKSSGSVHKLRRQPAGHYFSFLKPVQRSAPITAAEAIARQAAARSSAAREPGDDESES